MAALLMKILWGGAREFLEEKGYSSNGLIPLCAFKKNLNFIVKPKRFFVKFL
jgi:hypothetical protein